MRIVLTAQLVKNVFLLLFVTQTSQLLAVVALEARVVRHVLQAIVSLEAPAAPLPPAATPALIQPRTVVAGFLGVRTQYKALVMPPAIQIHRHHQRRHLLLVEIPMFATQISSVVGREVHFAMIQT
ncbi:MAG: hypothetical protein COU68_04340 [Candidatus Pacebacteria bacterium CG10_big_fil_rev_8_21_14_0_10_45_6]|nr:MAG: hypothetical protein COU68_04340 [Candidatus Pacebacteria bacterium CG10_big_fil_rev_8_21_14_0_10_45_6]